VNLLTPVKDLQPQRILTQENCTFGFRLADTAYFLGPGSILEAQEGRINCEKARAGSFTAQRHMHGLSAVSQMVGKVV
jgi:hypothetical protein